MRKLHEHRVRPGTWVIEGYDVRRVNATAWRVSLRGRKKAVTRTLSLAREWIGEPDRRRQPTTPPRLVSTAEAADVLGFNAKTLSRWAAEDQIIPDVVTPGGHLRWNLTGLRRQLAARRRTSARRG